ncbi:hypothetical protein EJB05_49297, partial [Eragrostis curvula]
MAELWFIQGRIWCAILPISVMSSKCCNLVKCNLGEVAATMTPGSFSASTRRILDPSDPAPHPTALRCDDRAGAYKQPIPLGAILLLAFPNDPSTGVTHAIAFFIMGFAISWNASSTNKYDPLILVRHWIH